MISYQKRTLIVGPIAKKSVINSLSQPLDVRMLQREKGLEPGMSYQIHWFKNSLKFATADVSIKENILVLSQMIGNDLYRQSVAIAWTPCHYGGQRPWFLCPFCNNRLAILYLGMVLACRKCQQLAYKSQRESHIERCFNRALNIRERLKWPPGISTRGCTKPKGMHQTTYWRLHEEYMSLMLSALSDE
jgi:hypothetical protein